MTAPLTDERIRELAVEAWEDCNGWDEVERVLLTAISEATASLEAELAAWKTAEQNSASGWVKEQDERYAERRTWQAQLKEMTEARDALSRSSREFHSWAVKADARVSEAEARLAEVTGERDALKEQVRLDNEAFAEGVEGMLAWERTLDELKRRLEAAESRLAAFAAALPSEERIAELRRLDAEATPGPWTCDDPFLCYVEAFGGEGTVCEVRGFDGNDERNGVNSDADKLLIPAARNLVPSLLDIADLVRKDKP